MPERNYGERFSSIRMTSEHVVPDESTFRVHDHASTTPGANRTFTAARSRPERLPTRQQPLCGILPETRDVTIDRPE